MECTMECTFENYSSLQLKGSLIGLEYSKEVYPYWCYPLRAVQIGMEGSILYCFIDGYAEMVFAANPDSCADRYVYPLARNLSDFLALVLACGSANPVEQIVWMSKEQFATHLCNEAVGLTEEQKHILDTISRAFSLTAMKDPYEYVRQIQSEFDGSRIQFSEEYYDILGLEIPGI